MTSTVRDMVGRGGSLPVDGFLAPTGDRRQVEGMYSDQHGGAGYNIQVAATLDGVIAAVGAPVPGARHDTYAVQASGLAQQIAGHDGVGDKEYQGSRHHPPNPQTPERRTD